jgi:phage shock protein PspC (stress-responsive transcriptional regulator)
MIYFIIVAAFSAGFGFGIAATLIYWPWMEPKATDEP